MTIPRFLRPALLLGACLSFAGMGAAFGVDCSSCAAVVTGCFKLDTGSQATCCVRPSPGATPQCHTCTRDRWLCIQGEIDGPPYNCHSPGATCAL